MNVNDDQMNRGAAQVNGASVRTRRYRFLGRPTAAKARLVNDAWSR